MKKYIRTIILMLLISSAVVADAELCHVCNKEVTGTFYIYKLSDGDRTVCSDCRENLGACLVCGLPVLGTSKTQSDILCSSCRLSADKCDVCGKAITGKYYTNEAKRKFCSECYQSAARCDFCNTVLIPGEWSYSDNQAICDECLKVSPRCTGCDQLINGKYNIYTGFEGVYCDSCKTNTPACLSCLRPCGSRPVRLDNGQFICRDCSQTAICDAKSLRSIIVEVSGYLERSLLMPIHADVQFKIVDNLDHTHNSLDFRQAGQFTRSGDNFSIDILKGLSRPICLETLAHELAHAWQSENYPDLKDKELVEGFAQWVAGIVLENKGYPAMVERLSARDDVYGRGYRRLKEWERLYGFSGVFDQLKKHSHAVRGKR